MSFLLINSDADIDGGTSAQIECYDGNCEVRITNPAAENGYEPEEGDTLDWLNSARIYVDGDLSAVRFVCSTGDPRGGFVWELWRDSNGDIMMKVPYVDEGFLHSPLEEIRLGLYRVR
tara:strand:+ start:5479 stop:5832 length:354 start_codon:yes stop_codon:yes gene_type:complete